jgi:dTDP-4-dehydrorhamnose 3,5-epimerase
VKVHSLSVVDAYLIEPERLTDERGFFARTWCSSSFADMGLNPHLRQCSISFNETRHTLRGLHYQRHPHAEAKLVRCTQGVAYHVVVDLRKESATYLQWSSATLSAVNRNMLYVPEDVAHGFITLQDATEIFYQMSEFHVPESAMGVRWDDPAFRIDWPAEAVIMSERDRGYADYIV